MDSHILRNVVHDLRGPVVSLKGFHSELEESIDRIRSDLIKLRKQERDINHENLNTILQEDLDPILKYMSMSIRQLSERLDALEGCSLLVSNPVSNELSR